MAENNLSFLKNAFSDYNVQISDDGTHAIMISPFDGENIDVDYDEADTYTPFTAYFSFQHRHLSGKEDVVDWINEIVLGKKFAIEFFKDGENRFGGEIEAEKLVNTSYEKLGQETGYYNTLIEVSDSFKVRGWNPKNNFDAVFVCGEDGTVAIEKHFVSR